MDSYLIMYDMWQDAQNEAAAPPVPMTLERARALVAADAAGVGMSAELLEAARVMCATVTIASRDSSKK